MSETLPLFPLRTVLFPGGFLPLRIFEPRYVDMVGERMRARSPFGVVAIREGGETGPAVTYEVGTLASIVDFDQGEDGLLGIVAEGGDRFSLLSSERRDDGLLMGEIEPCADETGTAVGADHADLAELLDEMLDRYTDMPAADRRIEDASWVGFRLAEVLPVGLGQRQYMLELTDAQQRLEVLRGVIAGLAGS